MSASPRCFPEKTAIVAVFVLIQTCCITHAQDFTIRFANLNPFEVNGPLPFGEPFGLAEGKDFKGGVNYGVGLHSTYDSNFFQTSSNRESEFSTILSPHLAYSTDPEGGARIQMSADYSPVARAYRNNPHFNGVDQSANVSMVIYGSRTVISAYAGYTQESGNDRFANEFVTGSALGVGIRGSYQLAPRTSVFANWAPSSVDYGDGSVIGSSGYSLSLGGWWAATEYFSLGPNLSYVTINSDNTGTRDSWRTSVQASYKMAESILVAASLGLQYSQNSRESKSGSTDLTGSLNASYQINELWWWSSSIQSGIVPSPTQTNYLINNWSISSSLNRSLVIGSIGVGVDMAFSNYEQVGAVQTPQGAEDNLSAVLTYSRPIFGNRLGFNSSVRYVVNSGQKDWSQIQMNIGLSMGF